MDEQTTLNIECKVRSISKELGIDYDNLKPKTKKHLINIESSITNREFLYYKLSHDLKDNKVTLTSVAKDSKISSRQTLYNNKELKDYIDFRMLQVNERNPYHQIDELKAKIHELNEKLELMIKRDIDTEILRNENKILSEQIKNKNNTITRLNEQSANMELKIAELRKKSYSSTSNSDIKKSKGKVIELDKTK